MAEQSALKQIVEKIKDSNNVLVTVNTNPSVDELSAALGITLLINKLNKHATAVFSGNVPPAIEFLNPEKTFENTVDSLRDFIIALDKEKADHLRYKVVDDMVKIFITPYRTTISQDDLDFSQGDYNVEAVLAIGVKTEEDLDHALESHGKILHDATVAAISLGEPTKLGGIEWADGNASSYSEMLFNLADGLKGDKNLVDEQIATAFLTGIVAATDRFSNSKTSSKVMTIAAQLMSAGANQQLIATKLQEDNEISQPTPSADDGDLKEGESAKVNKTTEPEKKKSDQDADGAAGALSISHVPEGTVDEVAKEVATDKSEAAVDKAEEELAKQAKTVVEEQQADATEAAEQKLAEQLAATPAAAGVPSVADLQKDIANASADVTSASQQPATPEPAVMRGAVALDQWKARSEQEAPEPSFGGTLNATTEQAEDDKRREIEEDRNRTILSHGGAGAYTTSVPTFQSPLNAVAAEAQAPEPVVRDIFAENAETAPTDHVAAIQPPAPSAPAPTLAEIDAQNRAKESDARAAIDAALNDSPAPTSASAAPGMPALPPLPPMPDFSTLPPLPPEMATSAPGTTVPDQLGSMLPPTEPAQQQAPASFDPAQFKIPGQ